MSTMLQPAPLRVAEMTPADRPHERLRNHGPQALGTAELLAIILGADTAKRPVIATAHNLLAAHGTLRRLAMQSPASLRHVEGMTATRAATIHAAMELGRRLCAESRDNGAPIRSPKDVVAAYAARLEDLPVEEFHVAVLDSQHRLERDVTVTRGILNSSLVHPREVFREAIAEKASAIVLVHNHPSGDPTPSADDRLVTDQLVAAGRLLDIPVHDHIIIGRGRYTSFAEAGLI